MADQYTERNARMVDFSAYAHHIPTTGRKRIVVIGGGFAGMNFIQKLPRNKYQIVLFDKHNYHTFAPLLYQVAMAGLEAPSVVRPLRRLFHRQRNIHIRMLKVLRVDPEAKKVYTLVDELRYDYLVIATGTTPNFFGNEQIKKHAFPLTTLPNAVDIRTRVLQNLERASLSSDVEEQRRLLHFVLVGGGPTGVELSGALAELKRHTLPADYPDMNVNQMRVTLVEGAGQILPPMSAKSGNKAQQSLENLGVDIKLNTLVTDYDGRTVQLNNGETLESELVIWAAGVKGSLLDGFPEESIHRSKFKVDAYNRVEGTEGIFAIGDVTYFPTEAYPKGLPGVAQVGIQQGQHLAKNMHRIEAGKELKPFEYLDKGTLATIGRNRAVGDLPFGIKVSGFVAWFLWASVHLFYLVGFRNRLVTFINWAFSYISYSNKIRIIIHPVLREGMSTEQEQELARVNEESA